MWYDIVFNIFLLSICLMLIYKDYLKHRTLLTQDNIREQFDYVVPKITCGYSHTKQCRGVFSKTYYKEGDIIEISPAILCRLDQIQGKIADYIFKFDEKRCLLSFGYISMYNHDDDCNAEYEFLDDKRIKLTATRDINIGEEITISYGEDYWVGRTHMKKL